MAYVDMKCHFVYIMKLHKYERTIVLKKYAHNVLQGSFACFKVLITYEPQNICGSYHSCILITYHYIR